MTRGVVAGLMVAGVLASGTAWAGTVRLTADDGVALTGTSWGSGEKGVLLVHGQDRSAADWENFAEKLSSNGFYVLAVNLRGHGGSGGKLSDEAWPLMVKDVTAATAWLSKHGATHVAVIGAEVGGNLALNAANGNAHITSLAMLSPTLNTNGVKVSAAIGAYGDRPLLLVADATDTLSAKAAKLLEQSAVGDKKVALLDGAGSGVRMINTARSLEGILVGWLNDASGGAEALTTTDRDVSSGDVSDIETTGTRFGDRE